MAKIKFDYENIKGIIPNLEEIGRDLQSLSTAVGNMEIPYDFRADVTGFQNDVQAVDKVLDNIIESNRLLDELVDTYSNFAKTLPNYIIEKRDTIVKI